mgnify:CR=1 FL=1
MQSVESCGSAVQFVRKTVEYEKKIKDKRLVTKFNLLQKKARDVNIRCPWSLSSEDKLFRFLELDCREFGDFYFFIKHHLHGYCDQLESFFDFCHILAKVLTDWHDKREDEFQLAVEKHFDDHINQPQKKRQKILTAFEQIEQDGAVTKPK